jgi:hypothetical protein
VYVPAWQLAVFSYRKAYDDHIQVVDFSQGKPVPLDQAEYDLKVGVPTCADDSDNFVTGLAVDYSHKVRACGAETQLQPTLGWRLECLLLCSSKLLTGHHMAPPSRKHRRVLMHAHDC